MWGRHFDWHHFRPPRSTLTPKRVAQFLIFFWGEGALFDIWIPAKRRRIEQNFVLKRIGESHVGFRSVQIPTHNTSITPKIGDLKTFHKTYRQTVVDGATLWIDRHCEDIVFANTPNYSVYSHSVCRLKKYVRLSPTICGIFLLLLGPENGL